MANKKVHHQTGIMNKMRDKMPVIIIILIVAFLATIIFEWGMNYLGLQGETYVFGKINDEEIKYQEFEQQVQMQVEQMRQQNPQQDIDENTMNQIRESVWNQMVQQVLVRQEINRLGITVSDNEILDIIYNRPDELPQPVKQNFIDSTGNFNVAFYQQALTMKTPEATAFWVQVEKYMRETLLSQKLQTVISNSIIITYDDILQKYKNDNIFANFEYVFFDPSTITDSSLFAATEEQMKKYYEENKNEFKQPEAVKFKYILLNEVPTADDTMSVKKLVEGYIEDFKNVSEEDSALIKFVNQNSKTPYNGAFQNPSKISKGALEFLNSASPGDVSDVIIDNDGIKIVRLLESREGEEQFVKASHILFNLDAGEEAARKKAEDVLARVKAGEDFSTIAQNESQDPTAKENKGSLGWFGKGAMVPEFENAAFSGSVGSIVGPVKTSFGYHIIKIEGKSNKEFRFAEIKEVVSPGSKTKGIYRQQAENIFNVLQNGENIDSVSKREKVTVLISPEITKDGTVPGLGQNKKIIEFGLKGNVGEVANPIKTQKGYGVYQIVEKISEGYKNYDSVKVTLIKPKVDFKNKMNILMAEAKDIRSKIQGGNLSSIEQIKPGMQVQKADSVLQQNLPSQIGQDFVFGTIVFNMKNGDLSEPIFGTKGVYIVKMNNITPFNEQDFREKVKTIRHNLFMERQQRAVQDWLSGLQSKADITDNRDIFYN
ncbi:hypothetical protein FBQ84_04765 [Ignavibacteria bacterium CHB1]|jgi:parvulin-like peptidyl-prolyl isomerase|nr:MAG: hypothetical protein EDM69_05185 [Chlorobiota bacterium]KXK06123.1 MAG: Parvulin-like peptidyl-prolyl isomerase [Chlorobi bacterium OLB4]MBV6398552.1 Chaperone SurA [Ignavibacteria bacterium]MCC6885786.1 peptidylprolyl isomerase [Ignavibacteriales bacterium]MCE7953019.1 hypothetical protein [Chlorobi bacterium CHB7]MDL1887143.1 hypothetical protein [Ignavibacteria bacterium CHB1]OQY78036.1 MAG: hypothetical protein B6D43_05850 [Ignavibacteriales bacterium UTCHB1]RIK49840.1 MAG: hypot